MLKGVTNERNIGKVSGFAWGLGYIGGIILLLISLVGFVLPDNPLFGIGKENAIHIRTIFIFASVWILVFTIPLLLWVPEIEKKANARKESILASYKGVFQQLKTLRKQAPETFKFLISSAVYRDGLSGVFTFGAVLGTLAFGFDTTSIIFYGIGANIIAAIGAAIGGLLDDRFGSRAVILGSLIGLIAGAIALFLLRDLGPITYWIFGLLLTLFVGPAQASSRTFVSRFTPQGREGEVFGLYQTTGRAISFLSGTMWATSIALAAMFLGEGNNTIYGIWGIVIILIVGAFLLSRVHPRPAVISTEPVVPLVYAQPEYVALPGARNSSTAVVAIVAAFFIPLLGIILGNSARKEIRNSKGKIAGDELATVAIVLGWIWVVVILLWLFVFLSTGLAK
jgi:UMF1 family MFS transporter